MITFEQTDAALLPNPFFARLLAPTHELTPPKGLACVMDTVSGGLLRAQPITCRALDLGRPSPLEALCAAPLADLLRSCSREPSGVMGLPRMDMSCPARHGTMGIIEGAESATKIDVDEWTTEIAPR